LGHSYKNIYSHRIIAEEGMKKGALFLTAPVFLGLILFFACTQHETAWKGTVFTEDGVTVVKNPKEPIYEATILELQEDLTISGSSDDEEQMFQNVHTLDIDAEGNLYILDEQAANIKVFDQNGNFLKTIGRKGQGPGEFGLPISLALTPDQQILVNEMGQRRLLFFDLEGNFLRQISLADMFLFLGPMIASDGHLIAMHTVPGDKPQSFLKKFSPDLEPILTFASAYVERPPVADMFVALHLTRLLWTLRPDDTIVWADIKNPDYVLHVQDLDGILLKKITKEFDPIPITAEDRERLLDKAFGDNPTRDQWDVRFPDTYPPFKGFSFDDEGRLFVRRYEREERADGELFDIFDAENHYVASQRLRMNPLIWKKGRMYAIEDDEEGFNVVKRYLVTWKH
jgi:hypothetical protein